MVLNLVHLIILNAINMIEIPSTITDEYMKDMISKTKEYCIVLLKEGPNCNMPGADKVVWEHGRRNFALYNSGLMPVVCPVSEEGNLSGMGIFTTAVDETKKIMDEDPAVKEGIFIYEVHQCRSFPGSALP
jgi:hypothetical protein